MTISIQRRSTREKNVGGWRSSASRRMVCLAFSVLTAIGWTGSPASRAQQPTVENGSFEADRFAKSPGYVRRNGNRLTGWTVDGSVGVNPCWSDPTVPSGPRHFFSDNGQIPHGRQVCLLQNRASIRQTIARLSKDKRYRVTYYENARHNEAPDRRPRLLVTLGDVTIVSEHAVRVVDEMDHRSVPYDYVESAPFSPPVDGDYELRFQTTVENRVTALIDRIQIVTMD